RADGATTRYHYDPSTLVVVGIEDAEGHTVRAEIDPHLMTPWRLVDANANVFEARHDPFGVALVTTHYGEIEGPEGSLRPFGNAPLASHTGLDATSVEALLSAPEAALQGADRVVAYDLASWE